jgi:UDP-N-acetylglucosamine 2-epimerase (non-hydrolysing)
MQRLSEVGDELPVLFPVHPRTRKRLDGATYSGVTLTDPVGYLDFLSLEYEARAVLTDSGGIQEETTYLGIPCFTLRDNTERPVTIRAGTNTLLGLDPARIAEIPELLRARPAANRAGSAGEAEEPVRPNLWDGRAAERIADVLSGW